MAAREKVFVDPLAAFDEPDTTAPKDEIVAVTSSTEEFRTLNTSKVQLKEKKGKKASKVAEVEENVASVPVEKKVEKNLKTTTVFGSNDNLFLSTNTTKATPGEDIFSTLSINDTEAGDDIFGSHTNSKLKVSGSSTNTKVISAEASNSIKQQKDKYSIFHTKSANDSDYADLGAAKMLETESLDFDTFGNSNVRHGGYTVTKDTGLKQTNLNKEEDELMNLEALLGSTNTTSAVSKTITSKVALKDTAAEIEASNIEVDYNNLNLDAYISQQESNSGGGLFD